MRHSCADRRSYQIATSPPLLVAGLISIGACLSRLRGSRAFAVDAVEVIRRTLVVLFEMDSMNVGQTPATTNCSYEVAT